VVESVYCAVRTDYLYKADYVECLQGQTMYSPSLARGTIILKSPVPRRLRLRPLTPKEQTRQLDSGFY
jgi:hypothetical protein